MTLKKKLFTGTFTLLLVAVVAVVVVIKLKGGRPEGMQPLAPNASEAPKAGASAASPKCEWPRDFSLSTDVQVKVPDVPEEIQGATSDKTAKK